MNVRSWVCSDDDGDEDDERHQNTAALPPLTPAQPPKAPHPHELSGDGSPTERRYSMIIAHILDSA